MTHRIGSFLMFLGVLLIALFILSDIADAPSCNLLVLGAVALVGGVLLWFRDPPQPEQRSDRFRLLRYSGKKKPDEKKK